MKKSIITYLLFSFLLGIGLSSCSSDDKDTPDVPETPEKETLIGYWTFKEGAIKSLQFFEENTCQLEKEDGTKIAGKYTLSTVNGEKMASTLQYVSMDLEGYGSINLVNIGGKIAISYKDKTIQGEKKKRDFELGFIVGKRMSENKYQLCVVNEKDEVVEVLTTLDVNNFELLLFNENANTLYYTTEDNEVADRTRVYKYSINTKESSYITWTDNEDIKITADGNTIFYIKDFAEESSDNTAQVIMKRATYSTQSGEGEAITEQKNGFDIDDWSIFPDGSIIVFKADVENPANKEEDDRHLYVVDTKNKKQTKIAVESKDFLIDYAQLSPDSKTILTGDELLICSCDIDGKNQKIVKHLPSGSAEIDFMKWSVDGAYVYYDVYNGVNAASYALQVANGEVKKINIPSVRYVEETLSTKIYK